MGPPALTGGWAVLRARLGGAAAASMGPPALTGGWATSACHARRLSSASFNGAAGSHRRMATEGARGSRAVSMLQWGRRLSPADGPHGLWAPGQDAMMLQWGRRLSPADGLNPDPQHPHLYTLQWGRRLSPADGFGNSGRPRSPRAASMGPPALTGGWTEDVLLTPGSSWLQWGRRLSPADGSFASVQDSGPRSLQWGRRLSPADGALRRADLQRDRRRFNGAAGSHRRMA